MPAARTDLGAAVQLNNARVTRLTGIYIYSKQSMTWFFDFFPIGYICVQTLDSDTHANLRFDLWAGNPRIVLVSIKCA